MNAEERENIGPLADPPASPAAYTGVPVEVAPGVRVPEAALRFQYARSSGPGGQNVNKVNTKAELWVPLAAITGLSERGLGRLRARAGGRLTAAGDIRISSDTRRTQTANRAAAMDRQ